jgi:hypothetical protein
MKLRYFQSYDQNGLNSEVALQYWDTEIKKWVDVPFVRVSVLEESEAHSDPYYK